MQGFPAPLPAATAHFSVADFFHDCPWLNVPAHRKADILVEPLYPRLGLLGGAPEAGGKMSKLAALAAARKKKECEKAAAASEGSSTPQTVRSEVPSLATSGTMLSISERLAASKLSKASETNGGLRRLGKQVSSAPSPARQQRAEPNNPSLSPPESTKQEEPEIKLEPQQQIPSIRAPPSTFASAILGSAAGPTMAEPSHLNSNNVDLFQIYGQDYTEPFDFAAPSPDDVVMNAQNTAKGLAIRRKG